MAKAFFRVRKAYLRKPSAVAAKIAMRSFFARLGRSGWGGNRSQRLIGFFIIAVLFMPARVGAATTAKDEQRAGMVLIPAGEFVFGSSEADIDWVVKEFFSESREWYLDETPAQKVYVEDYFIDIREVAVGEYGRFITAANRPPPKFFDDPRFNQPAQPVVGVAWEDARDYCEWAGKRLPSEAEWEKAARGGDARRYPWGNEPEPLKANMRGLADQYRYTAPVGSFSDGRSPYGVRDLAGNVWEWVENWYLPYPGNAVANEMYGQTLKVIRGGSWDANPDLARSAMRGKALPVRQQNTIGFRCAASAKP